MARVALPAGKAGALRQEALFKEAPLPAISHRTPRVETRTGPDILCIAGPAMSRPNLRASKEAVGGGTGLSG
jgi:hypothetical protein